MCARGDPVTRKRRSNCRLSKNFKSPHLSTQASEEATSMSGRVHRGVPRRRAVARSVGFACTSLPSAKSKPPTKNRDKKRSNQPTADYEEKKAVERHLQGGRGGGVVVVSFIAPLPPAPSYKQPCCVKKRPGLNGWCTYPLPSPPFDGGPVYHPTPPSPPPPPPTKCGVAALHPRTHKNGHCLVRAVMGEGGGAKEETVNFVARAGWGMGGGGGGAVGVRDRVNGDGLLPGTRRELAEQGVLT